MKVLVVLGLIAITAVFAAHHHHTGKLATLKKKLIGGPDSLPFFLRKNKTVAAAPAPVAEQSGFADVKAKIAEKAKKIHAHVKSHGKKALTWIKNKINKKNQTTEVAPAPVAEQSGFADVKAKIAEKANKIHAHVKHHGKKALNWLKNKFSKKNETVAEPTPAVEQSGFAEVKQAVAEKAKKIHAHVKHHGKKALNWLKNKFSKKNETVAEPVPAVEQSGFADVKAKIAEKANKIHAHVKHHGKKALNWLKNKFSKKNETVAEPTPAVEQSGFADVKAKVAEKAKKIHAHVKHHGKKALNWLKNKFNKKNETVAEPVPAVEQSGFAEVKTTVAEKANKIHAHVKHHAKKAINWFKSKFNKKTETVAEPTPVAEQSGFADDAKVTAEKVKESAKNWFNKLHNKAKEGYAILNDKLQISYH